MTMLQPPILPAIYEITSHKKSYFMVLLLGFMKFVLSYLYFVGWLVAVISGFLVFFLVISRPDTSILIDGRPTAVVEQVLGILGIWMFWILMSRKKKLLLFLRKFNDAQANENFSSAMYRVLKGQARLIVLDDGDMQPVSLPRRERFLGVLAGVPLFISVAFCLLLGNAVSPPIIAEEAYLQLGIRNYADENGLTSFITVVGGPVRDSSNSLYGPVLLSFPAAIFGWLVIVLTAIPAWRYTLAFRETVVSIDVFSGIRTLVRRMRIARNKFTSPKSFGALVTVVRCSEVIWKDAVATAVSECDAIVIDISHFTESLQWEMEFIQQNSTKPLLLTISSESLCNVPDAKVTLVHSLLKRPCVSGVLVWSPSDSASRKNFVKSLDNFVDRIDRS